MFISNLTWNVIYSAIQTEFSRQTNTTNTTSYSSIPYMLELKIVNIMTFTCRARIILKQRLEMRIGKMYK